MSLSMRARAAKAAAFASLGDLAAPCQHGRIGVHLEKGLQLLTFSGFLLRVGHISKSHGSILLSGCCSLHIYSSHGEDLSLLSHLCGIVTAERKCKEYRQTLAQQVKVQR